MRAAVMTARESEGTSGLVMSGLRGCELAIEINGFEGDFRVKVMRAKWLLFTLVG